MTANTADFLDELAKKDPKAAERLRTAEAAHDKANGHAKEEAPNTGQEGAAEFVIGDRFGSSCNDVLSATALQHLSAAERRVAHNRPYAGGYVLERHGAPRRGIHALQLRTKTPEEVEREEARKAQGS